MRTPLFVIMLKKADDNLIRIDAVLSAGAAPNRKDTARLSLYLGLEEEVPKRNVMLPVFKSCDLACSWRFSWSPPLLGSLIYY